MGISEATAASISGVWDIFDRAVGVTTWIERMMSEILQEEPCELHTETNAMIAGLFGAEPQAGMHLFDPNRARLEDLERARQMINDACLICQNVLAEI